MPFPIPHLHPRPVHEPPAIVRSVLREDVLWNRPIFKAPPLVVPASVFADLTLDEEMLEPVQDSW